MGVSCGEQLSNAAASEDEELISDDDVESEDDNVDLAVTTDMSDKDVEIESTDADGICLSYTSSIIG